MPVLPAELMILAGSTVLLAKIEAGLYHSKVVVTSVGVTIPAGMRTPADWFRQDSTLPATCQSIRQYKNQNGQRIDRSWHILTQAERDLLWTVNSPSLIRLDLESVERKPLAWVEQKFDSDRLHARLAAAAYRQVGRYFEELLHFYLEVTLGLEIVERGLQIREEGRTVGEIDFLYRDASGSLCHCESAVKFYLYVPEIIEGGSQFVGPNAADHFERKMRRLFDHQLRLSEGRFPDVVRREAFVKGRIFYHPLLNEPDLLSAGHLKGTWIRESEIDLFAKLYPGMKFKVVRKPHWLAPEIVTASDQSLLTIDGLRKTLLQHFAERRTPQLISALTQGESCWEETSRTFVVSDQWPRGGH